MGQISWTARYGSATTKSGARFLRSRRMVRRSMFHGESGRHATPGNRGTAICRLRAPNSHGLSVTHRSSTIVLKPGQCRVCGCTETTPCIILVDEGTEGPCGWLDVEATVCTNPRCVAQIDTDELVQMAMLKSNHIVLENHRVRAAGR